MKTLISTISLLLASVGVAHAGQYLQASSTITQCPGTAPEVVQIDVTDTASGIAMADNKIRSPSAKPDPI